MATHSSILAWRTSWAEEPEGPMGVTKSQTRLMTEQCECVCVCVCLIKIYLFIFGYYLFILATVSELSVVAASRGHSLVAAGGPLTW